MRVNCENCNTNFNLDEGLVKSSGSKVRCSKCKHIFMVYPPQPVEKALPEDVGQDTVEASQPPLDEVESAASEDLDAKVSEEMGASDASLSDEASTEEGATDDLDLSDIEKMLETEQGPETPEAKAEDSLESADAGDAAEENTLDLSEIEKILDEEDDSDEMAEEKIGEDQDLVFDLDEEIETAAEEEQISPTTELDLGDLEKMFESEEGLEPSIDEEASLSLELETGEDDMTDLSEAEKGGMTDELDLETEEKAPVSEPEDGGEPPGFDMETTEEEDGSLRLSDAEATSMLDIDLEDEEVALEEDPEKVAAETEELELETKAEPEATPADTDDVDLETEAELELETPTLETEPLDFSSEDISEVSGGDDSLETKDISADAMAIEGREEKLEDVDGISAESLKHEAAEEDLTDFGGEVEIDFPDEAVPDIPDEEEVLGEEATDLEDDLETEELYEESLFEKPKGGLKKVVFGLLAVVVVIVLVLAALLFLQHRGILQVPYLDQIKIPFLSQQKTSQVADVGNLKITYNVDNYRFLDSEKAGRLFIVTGKVKNEYSGPRSFIQMSGSLYTKGKTKAASATAYCGNVIADLELSQMTAAAIRTRLGNRSGENNTNVNIKPGEERPFMIVFFDLPKSLDEFTVAVAGSTEGDG